MIFVAKYFCLEINKKHSFFFLLFFFLKGRSFFKRGKSRYLKCHISRFSLFVAKKKKKKNDQQIYSYHNDCWTQIFFRLFHLRYFLSQATIKLHYYFFYLRNCHELLIYIFSALTLKKSLKY